MKKKISRHNRKGDRDTMRPEYDFSTAQRAGSADLSFRSAAFCCQLGTNRSKCSADLRS